MTDLQADAFHHEAIQAVALWTGLCLLLLLALTWRVSAQRRKHRVSLGDGGHEPVSLAVRTFGNAIEYIPMGLVAITVVALLGWTATVIHVLGAALFLGRILHAVGMYSPKQPAAGRLFGMVLTYLVFLASAVFLIVGVFL